MSARARILGPTPENIAFAAESLRRGEIGGMPTETVYGLAGDAWNPEALARIFDAKERPRFDPLILHVSPEYLERAGNLRDNGALLALAARHLIALDRIPTRARAGLERLIARFWPGPLTLVLPKTLRVPDLATSGLPSVAIRMPRHPIAQALIDAVDRPLAAPSANRFGRISPTRARDVVEELEGRIEWVLDGGACEVGVESTVIECREDGTFMLLRPGGLPVNEIEALLNARLARATAPATGLSPLSAPGMLESHYAPAKPLRLLPAPLSRLSDPELESKLNATGAIGLLAFTGDPQALSSRLIRLSGAVAVVRVLSRDGSLNEAARHLFAELRALDASPAETLFAEPPPSLEGLGFAIHDRLQRASARRSHS